MSALAGLGIDNLHVDVAGPELPIMDGSAGPFVFLLQSAGIVEQNAPKRYLRVRAPVEVRDGDKWARFEPFAGFKLDFTIDFPHPVFGIGEPARRHRFRRALLREGSRARPHLRLHAGRRGDARGGPRPGRQPAERDRARRHRVLNTEGLRYDNEFVKHKVLDAIGDLYLLGHPLIGQYTRVQVGPRAQQRWPARCSRGPTRSRS